MTHRLIHRLLHAVCVTALVSHISYGQQPWTYRVVVAVEKQTAEYYQRTFSKDIASIVTEQLATVNANFNRSGRFNGIVNFQADSIYVFDGAVQNEVFRPHPRYDYNIVINGFSDNSVGGGWYGGYRTIYHSWPWDYFNGPFGDYATDGLTHEFGHARGAIDIYALRVDEKNNPVNHEPFEPVSSIMNYPYGNITWDEYTTNLLNTTGGNPIEGEHYITGAFPDTIRIKAVDVRGEAVGNATLAVYPVDWFSYSVAASPILVAHTDGRGYYQCPTNPYQPASSGYPWHIRYCNFLIKVSYDSVVAYKWMPLYDVQNAYFRNGANSAFTTEIQLPVNSPVIKLSHVSASTVCQEASISASFTLSGTFEPMNSFILFVVDNFNNSYGFSHVVGNTDSTLTGTVPDLPPATYKLRVVSNNPYAWSDDFLLTIKPRPKPPTVRSIATCEQADPPVLSATGQNLLWYTSEVGGTGSTTAPQINTQQASQSTYYVSQTVDGCEGRRSALSVRVNPLPAAPGVIPKTICQFAPLEPVTATGTNLTWYDRQGNRFATAPLIKTDTGAVFSYLVTQTIDGCEGPKATLVTTVRPIATATLTGSQTILEGQSANLLVNLTGDEPWIVSFRDSTAMGAGTTQSVQVGVTPYTLAVKPLKTTAYYLTSVSNVCGKGRVSEATNVILVMPLLGVEDQPLAELIDVFPIPAKSAVTVRIRGLSTKTPATLVLTNLVGQQVSQQEITKETSTITLDQQLAGTYVLHIRVGSRMAFKRIVKL